MEPGNDDGQRRTDFVLLVLMTVCFALGGLGMCIAAARDGNGVQMGAGTICVVDACVTGSKAADMRGGRDDD